LHAKVIVDGAERRGDGSVGSGDGDTVRFEKEFIVQWCGCCVSPMVEWRRRGRPVICVVSVWFGVAGGRQASIRASIRAGSKCGEAAALLLLWLIELISDTGRLVRIEVIDNNERGRRRARQQSPIKP
jgi:hypothetical protein